MTRKLSQREPLSAAAIFHYTAPKLGRQSSIFSHRPSPSSHTHNSPPHPPLPPPPSNYYSPVFYCALPWGKWTAVLISSMHTQVTGDRGHVGMHAVCVSMCKARACAAASVCVAASWPADSNKLLFPILISSVTSAHLSTAGIPWGGRYRDNRKHVTQKCEVICIHIGKSQIDAGVKWRRWGFMTCA